MPQARRSTSTRSRFKEPAALKRLNTSLDTAQKALTELGKGGGRDVGKGAGDLYKDLRAFVTSARRDSGKIAKALQKEFDQAQKELAKAAKGATKGRSTSRSTSKRGTSSRSTSSRSTGSRSTGSRSSSSRSTSSRSTGARASSKRSTSSGGSRRSSSKRGKS